MLMPRLPGLPGPVPQSPRVGRGKPEAGYSFLTKVNSVVVRERALEELANATDRIGSCRVGDRGVREATPVALAAAAVAIIAVELADAASRAAASAK